MTGRVLLGLLPFLLAGCAVGPDFERPTPATTLPGQWQSEPATNSLPRDFLEGREGLRWWTAFGDTVLNGLVREALEHNHDLTAAAARVQEAQAKLGRATSALLPAVSLAGTATRSGSSSDLAPPGATLTSNYFNVNATAGWEADLWGKLRRGREASVAGFLASEQEQRAAAQALVANVVLAWLQVKELQLQSQLTGNTVASYQESLDVVDDRFQAGLIPSLDVQLIRQSLAATQANEPSLAQKLLEARRGLEILVGRYPAGAISFTDSLPDPLPPVPAGIPSQLLNRRPDLLAAEARLHAATAGIGSARAALFPSFKLTAQGGSATAELANLLTEPTKVWNLAGSLFMPLINRGATQAQIKIAEAQTAQALAAYQSAVLRALAEVENALDRDRNLTLQESLLIDSVEQAGLSVELAEDRYTSGLDDLLLSLDARRRLDAARSQLLSIQRSRRAARVQLILALGGPWDDMNFPSASNEGAVQ